VSQGGLPVRENFSLLTAMGRSAVFRHGLASYYCRRYVLGDTWASLVCLLRGHVFQSGSPWCQRCWLAGRKGEKWL
jgi:hypothetical protein